MITIITGVVASNGGSDLLRGASHRKDLVRVLIPYREKEIQIQRCGEPEALSD